MNDHLARPWAISREFAEHVQHQLITGADAAFHSKLQATSQTSRTADVRACDDCGSSIHIRVDDEKPLYQSVDGINIVAIKGPVTKYKSWWSSFFGGTSSEEIAEAFDAAVSDPSMRAVVLDIDSPGGEVYGGFELAEHMLNLRKSGVPLYARVSDLAASLGYAFASTAMEIYGNATATVGSIGVYRMLYDTSKWYDKLGVKVHLLRSGDNKGVGADGVPVSKEELEVLQQEIDDLHAHFVSMVTSGRPQLAGTIDKVADGRVFVGKRALDAKLIDGVASTQQLLEMINKRHPKGSGKTRNQVGSRAEQKELGLLLAQRTKTDTIDGVRKIGLSDLLQ